MGTDGINQEFQNTKISYLYRDGANYKVYNEQIVKGLLSEEQKNIILDCLNEGEWFIPSQVGLPEKKIEPVDLAVDHPWFELTEDDFKGTNEEPTVEITSDALVAAFVSCKDNWDEFSWLNDLDYEPEETLEDREMEEPESEISFVSLNQKMEQAKERIEQENQKVSDKDKECVR